MRTNIAPNYDHAFLSGNFEQNGLETQIRFMPSKDILPQILCITSYPPRECGIATYSQDLIIALQNKFDHSFDMKICALELQNDTHTYNDQVDYVLKTDVAHSYQTLAQNINENHAIQAVLIQHEFGLFKTNEADFIQFIKQINKPIIVAFHTVLPKPDAALKTMVQSINAAATTLIVMTKAASKVLVNDYEIDVEKIAVIPHGTHLVAHANKDILKEKYNLAGRKIVSTFGLLSSGKCIETTIIALKTIVKIEPDVLFLIIGKTHPNVVKNDGEEYRDSLKQKIKLLHLERNVLFINQYLPLHDLLEYLQLTDIYLFTSKDRNQAVSGTFSYAISCGCPIISTPIPHACEVLKKGVGIIIDFEKPKQLAKQVILQNPEIG